MYLLDSNIWLERLLEQSNADDVGRLLDRLPSNELFITDFAFHSICVILTRLNKQQALLDFAQDLFVDGDVSLLALSPEKTPDLLKAMKQFRLDFDDAYQYLTAKNNGLTLVSFDKDLKRKPIGGKTPGEILAALKE
jgi:uncharacterized protein